MPKQISGQIGLSGFPAKPDPRPPIGTIMYVAMGHAYYGARPHIVEDEFLVCQARVQAYYEYGNIPEFEILICAPTPNDYCPCYAWHVPELKRVTDIGKSVYWTPKEAAEKARELTEKHDETWGWCDPPMRRAWERLLDGADFCLAPLISAKYPEGGGAYAV